MMQFGSQTKSLSQKQTKDESPIELTNSQLNKNLWWKVVNI